jgi:hypothetical protein
MNIQSLWSSICALSDERHHQNLPALTFVVDDISMKQSKKATHCGKKTARQWQADPQRHKTSCVVLSLWDLS